MHDHHRHRRHRRRPRRPRREPAAHRRRTRARRARPRPRSAERWRTERWDSLHLLTPSWMTRLPGWQLPPAPTRTASSASARFVGHLERVRRLVRRARRRAACTRSPPARRQPDAPLPGRHRPRHLARPHVVIATGPHGTPHVPAGLAGLDTADVDLVTANRLPQPRPARRRAACSSSAPRRPACRSPTSSPGRAATSPSRSAGTPGCPRRYRGLDIFWWLENTGRLARTIDDGARPGRRPRARPRSSSSAATTRERATEDLDLGRLQAARRPPGRAARARSTAARPGFRDDLAATVGAADAAPGPASSTASTASSSGPAWPAELWDSPPARVPCRSRPPRRRLDLRAEGIGTVLVATGYRPAPPVAATADHRRRRDRSASTAASPPRRGRVRRRPALPAPARLRLHRRRAARRRARSSPTCSPRAGADRWPPRLRHRRRGAGGMSTRVRRRRRRAAGSPAPRPPCCWPAPACRSRCVDRGRRGSDTALHPRA